MITFLKKSDDLLHNSKFSHIYIYIYIHVTFKPRHTLNGTTHAVAFTP